jgi:predicted transposase YbfD/YdcC
MYCMTSRCVLPPLTQEQRHDLLSHSPLLSLAEVLDALPDPRGRHGLRYDLAFLLTCLVAALLCQCNNSEAVSQWCRDHQDLLRQLFGPRLFLTPSSSLYRWLLPQLDPTALEQILATWIQATLVAQADDPIAFDGKCVRGARTAGQEAPHLLSFCTHHSQETLLQIAVSEKTNEIPVAKTVLSRLPLAGRVCTADALHTHPPLMQALHDQHAFSLLTVKANQPTLYADLTTYFADPDACFTQAETWDRRRGRVEHRRIRVSGEMNAYLAPAWPHLKQVAELTRTVTKAGERTQEIVYLITDLSASLASPQRLLSLNRGHWGIENRLHYVRDVCFGEDRSRISAGNAPQILAALRNVAITLIHRTGSSQITASRRHFCSHPREAFSLLLSPCRAQQ